MNFLQKVKGLIAKKPGAVNTAIDKAGDLVDSKTKNKYRGQVDKAQEAAKKAANADNPNALPQTPPAAPPVIP